MLAMRRAYIDPILVAVACIAGEVSMAVECNVESPLANGPVDYLFTCEDQCICVTEGKYNNLDDGVSQNIAQLSAVRYDNNRRKRKHDETRMDVEEDAGFYFGIATTYLSWQFTELRNKKVRVSPWVSIGSANMQDDVRCVVALVAGMLNRGKRHTKKQPT